MVSLFFIMMASDVIILPNKEVKHRNIPLNRAMGKSGHKDACDNEMMLGDQWTYNKHGT